jgi:hypothetical protein
MPLEEPHARSRASAVMGIVTVLLAFGILIAFTVTGCGTPETTGWLGTETPPTTTPHTPPWFGETTSAWGVELNVSGPERYDNDYTTLPVGDGNKAWVMFVTINNTGSEDFSYRLACWEGRDWADHVYQATVRFVDGGLTDGTVRSGEIAEGRIGFELPEGMSLASVTYRPIGVGLDPKTVSWFFGS